MHYKNYSFDNIPELNEHIIEDNAIEILKMRYFMTFKDGFKETKFSQLCRRVARVIASSEYNYYYNAENENEFLNRVNNIEESIYNDMMSHRFLFNSPALFSAGSGLESKHFENNITDADTYRYIMNNATQNQMMFACFTLPVDDSLDGIFDSAKNAAIISKFGGGVGANFGNLREKDALIKDGIAGKSSGPISFMQVWNTMGSVVVQGGKRRAALMGMLYSNHPDIEEFVTCKTEDGNLNYFNISVAIDNDFMQAVENDLDYCLISPKNNKIIKTIKAKDLWDKICTSAHKRGDPGIFFVDLANEDSLIKDPTNKYKIESTNPCGEQPLPNSSSCNLGSINVAEFITEDNKFDEYDFGSQVVRSMYYLDLVIDATKYPLTEIEKRTKAIRPVGLGIMGLADLAIKLNIEYGSPAFLLLCKKIGQIMSAFSLISTIEIAKIKGSYDEYWEITDKLFGELNEIKDVDNERFYFNSITNNDNVPYTFKHAMYALALYTAIPISEWTKDLVRYGLRNSRRLSIAPTGTISLILNTSSSIEPNFAYEWTRTVTVNKDEKQELKYYHKLYNENNKNKGLLVSASDLSVMQHVETVAEFAKWIDSGISKTVNLAFESTVDDVKQIYEYCYNNKIKGITIYRDGSRNNQPLVKTKSKIENEKDTENNIIYELNVNNDSNSGIRIRPKIMRGLTTKSDSPYGSIYVTANFDDNNKMFETFISAGKSGSVSKSVTEALSRVISLALRSNVDINDIVKTISNISGSEIWVYDTINGKEVFVKSIPDVTAKMLADINDYSTNLTNNTIDIKTNNDIDINMDTEKMYNKLCPECGSTMIMLSGCQTCMNCGYSPCK